MAMGKADLKAKVCGLPAKYCLFLLCIAHVFVFLIVTGVVVYVYCTYQTGTSDGSSYSKPLEAGFLVLLVPGALALISGLGALMFLFIRGKLLMLICITWPILVGLAAALFYGMFIVGWSAKGTTWKDPNNSSQGVTFPTPVIVAISIGMLLLPLSCCCCTVLACMGFNKSDDGTVSQMKSPGKSKGKSQMNNGNMGQQQQQAQFNGNNMNGGGFQGNGNGNGNGNMNNNGGNQWQNQNQNQNNGGGNHGGGHKREQNHSGHLY